MNTSEITPPISKTHHIQFLESTTIKNTEIPENTTAIIVDIENSNSDNPTYKFQVLRTIISYTHEELLEKISADKIKLTN